MNPTPAKKVTITINSGISIKSLLIGNNQDEVIIMFYIGIGLMLISLSSMMAKMLP